MMKYKKVIYVKINEKYINDVYDNDILELYVNVMIHMNNQYIILYKYHLYIITNTRIIT